jgi:WD40 repeat protein
MDIAPTLTATNATAITQFPLPVLESGVSQQCLTIGNNLPAGTVLTGTLILDARPTSTTGNEGDVYLMTFPSGEIGSMPGVLGLSSNQIPTVYNISPGGKWFYYFEPLTSRAGDQLHISSINGQEQLAANWHEGWGQAVNWLDSRRLVVWPPVNDLHPYGFAIILDPFTGELHELPPNFTSSLNSLVLVVDYNSSLTRAVYLSGNYYILWDTQSQVDLWKRRGANYSYLLRGWSPDGDRFAAVITREDAKQSEIFLITPDGQETQLTYLAEAYPTMPEIYIEDLAWSPDGRYLAFVTKVKNDDVYDIEGPTLMVVDITTQQVVDYCIVASRYSGGHLVWSPTSQQLIVATPTDYQEYIENAPKGIVTPLHVVLIDIINQTATKLGENMAPMGWMVSP